ncbi:MAG TPA: IS110 family transposase [Propionibacteriaceae bacterium]|nr:IS110 family transposase [Propionibacteriaceae bacterium]
MLFVGDDWAEAHHDIEIEDDQGRVLVRRRLPEGVAGLAALHAVIGDHLQEGAEPEQVLVGIETDRGPWVQALIAAGFTVYPINPLQAARYRERHGVSGAKSDPGDAHVLAEIVRLDRAHHRPAAGDSVLAEQVRLAARAHQAMIWMRQRAANTLRSLLRECYPAALEAFGDDLAGRDALAVLTAVPDPATGRRLTTARVAGLLRKAGRQRNLQTRAEEIVAALRSEQLSVRVELEAVHAASVSALVASGTKRVVLARYTRNRRLADALYHQAFSALNSSPGARACYDRHRAAGDTHHQALRALANRLVGILHGCLRHHQPYNEATAWASQTAQTTIAA